MMVDKEQRRKICGVRVGIPTCLALLFVCLNSWAESLTLLTEEKPPRQMMVDGKLSGYEVEKMRLLMADARVDYTMEIKPWARAYQTAMNIPGVCVFSITRLPERETLFRWVGPFDSSKWVLYARSGSNIKIAKLKDIHSLRVGSYIDDVRGTYLRQLGYQVDFAPSDMQNIPKLLAGHIDLWAEDEQVARDLIAETDQVDQIVPLFTFKVLGLYLGCNPQTSAETIGKLTKSYNRLAAAGVFKAVDQRSRGAQAHKY